MKSETTSNLTHDKHALKLDRGGGCTAWDCAKRHWNLQFNMGNFMSREFHLNSLKSLVKKDYKAVLLTIVSQ